MYLSSLALPSSMPSSESVSVSVSAGYYGPNAMPASADLTTAELIADGRPAVAAAVAAAAGDAQIVVAGPQQPQAWEPNSEHEVFLMPACFSTRKHQNRVQ